MGARRDRLDKRIAAATASRRKNSARKTAERTRREESMLAILGKGQMPYTPGVMSWLSAHLNKKASRITPTDVKALLKKG